MGIKDNFQQALRELTGTEKDEQKQQRDNKSIDAMKSAVAAGDTSEFDAIKEIDRRAAAAASEYDRQQRAFTDGGDQQYNDTNTDSPFGQDVSYNGATGSFLGVNESNQPLSMGQMQDQGSFNTAPETNTGYMQSDGDLSYGSSDMNAGYQQTAQTGGYQNTGYQQTAQGGGYQSTGYQQTAQGGGYQNSGYQQNTGAGTYQQGDSGFMSTAGGSGNPANDQARIFSAARYQHPLNEDDEITVISRNTVIDGNVRSFANMSVDGNIKGNIETTKDIDLNGKIVGNIACNNAQMRTSQIQGNIQMKGNAYMERDTLLIGDLTSTYANVNGKIKGNLDITGKAELKSDAVVFGDISASTITVNDGAIIQGYVSTTFLNKEESKNIFPETITIGE